LVLASDEDRSTLDALKFSLASDIVELVVLTADDVFLQTLREAVGGARRLWHVPTADKVSDLLVAGEVGIVVIDVQALHEGARVFVQQIKRQFPDLVLVAAGHRDDETGLAGLISSGMVYRFIHKPMSPARAKLFAEAAIKKYEDQRRRAAETPVRAAASPGGRAWLLGGIVAAVAVVAAIAWIAHRSGSNEAASAPGAEAVSPAASDSTLPARAELAEAKERLLARAENALLEERLDEAAAAIETARQSGIEGGRIAFLTAQLAKSREQIKTAQLQIQQQARPRAEPKAPATAAAAPAATAGEDKITPLLNLATQRTTDGHLIEASDSAPTSVAAPANVESVQNLLSAARKQADVDARGQLLRNANERLLQDRLIEPMNDNAKYFYLTLKQLEPNNPALTSLLQDLGTRITAKARRALILGQVDAAKSWFDETISLGFNSAEMSSLQGDLDAAVAKQNFMTTLVPQSELTVQKNVQPIYPHRAESGKTEGWVDVEFTVAETGKVKDVSVRATSIPGVFEDAAVKAVSQWRYKPVTRDGRIVAVRTQIRVRFSMP
jgi:TonB family protein